MIRSRIVNGRFVVEGDERKPKVMAPSTIELGPIDVPPVGPAAPGGTPSPAPASNAAGGMARKPLGQYYQELEAERGLPSGFLAKTRAIESANGTNLVNPNSSARGDFQFIRSTARQYGINPMDPYQSARAAADMAASNKAALEKRGITPDGADLYATHQQGLGGYLKLRSGQSSGGAEMALNGGAGKTPGGFLSMWRDKFNSAKPANLGEGFTFQAAGANQGQGPTVANAAAAQANLPQNQEVQGPPMPNAEQQAAMAQANTYKGGLLGLFSSDSTAPGADKPFLAKVGDMASGPGGGSIGTALGGLAKMMAPQQQDNRPGISIQADNSVGNKPDASMMAFLDPRRRRMGMGA